MVSITTKMVPKKYYIIDGVELPANEVFMVLETIVSDGDSYDLEYWLYDCAEELYKLGYLVKNFGCHQSILYCDTEDKKASALFDEIIHS